MSLGYGSGRGEDVMDFSGPLHAWTPEQAALWRPCIDAGLARIRADIDYSTRNAKFWTDRDRLLPVIDSDWTKAPAGPARKAARLAVEAARADLAAAYELYKQLEADERAHPLWAAWLETANQDYRGYGPPRALEALIFLARELDLE